jgi:hypothetical protein
MSDGPAPTPPELDPGKTRCPVCRWDVRIPADHERCFNCWLGDRRPRRTWREVLRDLLGTTDKGGIS